jgi:integrase
LPTRYTRRGDSCSTPGLRIAEAQALRWSDVDLERGVLTVVESYRRTLSGPRIGQTKSHRSERPVPLNASARAALAQQRLCVEEFRAKAEPLGTWKPERDLVFPNGQGRPIRQDKTLAEFKAVQCAVGITPPRRLHDLRHTFATQLYARGVHPRAAQELLGHSRIEMTLDLYTSSVSDVLIDAVGLLDGTGFI